MQGLWEMSCDKQYASRLGEAPLRQLVAALESHVPMVTVVATATLWNLAAVSDTRAMLVVVGAHKTLWHTLRSHKVGQAMVGRLLDRLAQGTI